jgi:hypothetical protein
MEILFTKTSKEDQVLSCKRKDGSVTWKHASAFFMLHDLCHYAAETILTLKNGFFGMVAAGTDINEFDLPKEQRKVHLTEEAIFAEHLVNIVAIDYTQGRMENLIEVLTSVYDNRNEPGLLRFLTDQKLEDIRKRYRELMEEWNSLPETKSMILLFEE